MLTVVCKKKDWRGTAHLNHRFSDQRTNARRTTLNSKISTSKVTSKIRDLDKLRFILGSNLTKPMLQIVFKYGIMAIYFYLTEQTVDQFPYTNILSNFRHFNSCCNIQLQQEIGQSTHNYMIGLDLWSEFGVSQIPIAPYSSLKILK